MLGGEAQLDKEEWFLSADMEGRKWSKVCADCKQWTTVWRGWVNQFLESVPQSLPHGGRRPGGVMHCLYLRKYTTFSTPRCAKEDLKTILLTILYQRGKGREARSVMGKSQKRWRISCWQFDNREKKNRSGLSHSKDENNSSDSSMCFR